MPMPPRPPLQFLMEDVLEDALEDALEDVLKNQDGTMTAAHDCHDSHCSNWRHITLRTVAENNAGKKCNTILQQAAGKCICTGDCLFIQVLEPSKRTRDAREGCMGGFA